MFSKKILLNYVPLFFIILLAAILRFLWLDKVPNAIGGDELTYVINAKAIWISGTDISGTWNPLTGLIFKYPAYTLPQSELPYFLLLPIVGMTNFSLFNARITYTIFSILTVLLMYFVAKELFNRQVGIIAAFVAAINPWLIYIGRTDYETSPAMFFFLLGLYILLKTKKWRIFLSIPFLYLAFYSYIGTKLAFIPFVAVSCLYACLVVNKKKYFKQYLIVFLLSFILVGFFVFQIHSNASRLSEILLPNDPAIAKQVDSIRKVSIQTPLTNIFENKYTMFLRIIFTKLFKSFSFDYLFVYGDGFFSIFRNGLFYILDAFFLIIGVAATYANRRKAFWFISAIILTGALPQIFHTVSTDNFTIHLTLSLIFLIIFIAVGIREIINYFKNRRYFYVSSAIVLILYLLLLSNFLNIYFYQFPLQGYFDFQVRVLSKYVSLAKNSQQVLIYSPRSTDIFKKYLFYTNSYNKSTFLQIRSIYASNEFNFDNLKFLGCDNTIDPEAKNSVIVYDSNCGALKKNYSHLAIARLSDGGQSYEVFNDDVCKGVGLNGYPINIKISDFAIENMSGKNFCRTYITNP